MSQDKAPGHMVSVYLLSPRSELTPFSPGTIPTRRFPIMRCAVCSGYSDALEGTAKPHRSSRRKREVALNPEKASLACLVGCSPLHRATDNARRLFISVPH